MSDFLTMHHQVEAHPDISQPDPHQDAFSKAVLGFWIYLMTDCILFATFFITYAVLRNNTFGGVTAQELFTLKIPFIETMLLLLSSLTCGLALLEASKNRTKLVKIYLFFTAILGISFLVAEITEFTHFIGEGHSFTTSAFLSSYFGLVGAHGLHIIAGLLWLLVLFFQLIFLGLTVDTYRRLLLFNMFWHFLDVIWIFIFTFVYLGGVA
jgi:cytochrome o ubiquinol oxidase subunit III